MMGPTKASPNKPFFDSNKQIHEPAPLDVVDAPIIHNAILAKCFDGPQREIALNL